MDFTPDYSSRRIKRYRCFRKFRYLKIQDSIYNNNQENLKLYHLGYQKRLRIFKLQPSFFSNFSNFIILSTLRYHIYSFYLPNILNILGSMPSHSLTCLVRTDKTQYCRKITNLMIYNANNT